MNLIITGIPRSGTSYLCRLLHRVDNCVAINEPRQLFRRLQDPELPQVAALYQDLRAAILRGEAVENKLSGGQVTEDTQMAGDYALYHPHVTRADFVLATKNTLGYLARLPQLIRLFAPLPVVACIRHPLDSIASWKSGFPHLRDAAVDRFPTGSVRDPLLNAWQRNQLQAIAAETDLRRRRALLWCYLAEWLWQHRAHVLWVRYEDAVLNPAAVLGTLLATLPGERPLPADIQPSAIRHKRAVLERDEPAIIAEVCGEIAGRLGIGFN